MHSGSTARKAVTDFGRNCFRLDNLIVIGMLMFVGPLRGGIGGPAG